MMACHSVLVVDASAFMRKRLQDFFSRHVCDKVDVAHDGAEALEKIRSSRPDLLTIEVISPHMDGIDTITKIRENTSRIESATQPSSRPEGGSPADGGERPKILVISSLRTPTLVKKTIQAGANEYISKPWRDDALIYTVNRLFVPPDSPIQDERNDSDTGQALPLGSETLIRKLFAIRDRFSQGAFARSDFVRLPRLVRNLKILAANGEFSHLEKYCDTIHPFLNKMQDDYMQASQPPDTDIIKLFDEIMTRLIRILDKIKRVGSDGVLFFDIRSKIRERLSITASSK